MPFDSETIKCRFNGCEDENRVFLTRQMILKGLKNFFDYPATKKAVIMSLRVRFDYVGAVEFEDGFP